MAKLRILTLTYRMFPVALSAVREATADGLKRMGMRVFQNGPGDDGATVTILASGWRRELDVELEALGVRGTRMRVLAKEGVFFEENTANELIVHITRLLAPLPDGMAPGRPANVADPLAIYSSEAQVAALSR